MNLTTLNKYFFTSFVKKWINNDDGNVVVETAFVFPILMVLLMGSIDTGRGLLVNKKVTSAANIAADLIAREEVLDDDELNNYVEAARLAMNPYPETSFGIDIAGIRFIDESATPEVQWRETIDMSPNANVEIESEGLGKENEGVIAVTVEYSFVPQFSNIITGSIEMSETTYVRGRITSFVQRE